MVAQSVDVESARGQNADVSVPEKRKNRARWVSIILCTITAILVLTFCIANRTVVEYHPRPIQKNTTDVCYMKEEKLTFSGLFTTALGLFGVVLGTLVNRLSLIAEEHHHLRQRYGGSWKKMIKACFSGILWGPVIALLGSTIVILVVLIFVTSMPWFELSYLVYIFSGIGVGPLIMHLLNLNTQSEVHISTILEEKETYIANGLAWSYYFNYLSKALTEFREKFPDNIRTSVEDEGTQVNLSLHKLILLISYDCTTEDNLVKQDNKIKKLTEIADGVYTFPVYRLPFNEEEKIYVIKYVRQPLETLRRMSQYERIKALQEKQREYQVKLLYRTLSEILNNPLHEQCREKCILVPIPAEKLSSLQNGGLVNVIMREVKANESTLSRSAKPKKTSSIRSTCITCISNVFMKICCTRETVGYNDISYQDGKKGNSRPRKQDRPIYNQYENNALVNSEERQGNTLDGGKQLNTGESSPRERQLSVCVDVHEQQQKGKQIDSKTRNKQDNNSNDKKGKTRGETLCTNSKNKKSDEIPLQEMIPEGNHDPSSLTNTATKSTK